MIKPFYTQIQMALDNPNLQAALDANAQKRRQARQQAAAALPDFDERRQRAHALRAEVVANLDHYLEQFIENVQRNGIIVHRARDAAQAVDIILGIARQKGARLIAKSKTMVSEEIELNPALEAAGMRVVETDLGEYIVQLRGEHPSHIITPAVHLRRMEVGQTFHEKLGVPYTEDIPTMTEVARQTLRQVFLQADIGISGVNFGVAETGALCVLTNEGNGRMVTTVPPVHIALMGMERLAPDLEGLALMLSVLPLAATGQKITVYASLLHGPRRDTDPDGPQERHLVIVDNGRSRLRESWLAESLYCIRCGACLNACPVFQEIGGHAYVSTTGQGSPYSGPIGSVISPVYFGQVEFGHLARASSLCGACKEACPVDIDLPKMLLRVRAGGIQPETQPTPRAPATLLWSPLGIGLRLFTWIATSPARFHFIQRLAGLGGRLLSQRSGWLRLPAFTGWGYSKDFPSPAARPFREKFSSQPKTGGGSAKPAAPSWAAPGAVGLESRGGFGSGDPHERGDGSGDPHERKGEPGDSHERGDGSGDSNKRTTGTALSPAEQLVRFASELEALGGYCYVCSPQELGDRLVSLLQARGLTHLLAWEEEHLPDGLLKAIQTAGIQVSHNPDPALAATLKAGLTGAQAGWMKTGSVLLLGGAGRPLAASLLPELHLVVLSARDIHEELETILALPVLKEAAAAVLVTGPSRTADIEMTLTIGVHGPKEIHVFCLA